MVNERVPDQNAEKKGHQPMREYSHAEEYVNNAPYMAMIVLGTLILAVGVGHPVWRWIGASLYLLYGVVGALWLIVFLCPYCFYWNTRSCPCGYGSIAAKLRRQKPCDRFNEKFKKHIPVIVPLWFVPVLAGVAILMRSFSWPLLALLVVFVVDAFVVLPLFSTKHGCIECPQRDTCPWMKGKYKPATT